ncbi:hypothetical protein [Acinetobacter bereziniae]|nr:hypothetical protein [Acinetobacter bereziniae]
MIGYFVLRFDKINANKNLLKIGLLSRLDVIKQRSDINQT